MRIPRPLRWPRTATLTGLVLALLPIATVLWVHTATAAQQLGDVDAAIAKQRERVAENPSSAEAYNDLGNLLALGQNRAAAEEAYREALRLDPGSFSAHFNLAVLLRTGHRPAEALGILERALELEPNSAWAQYQLGAVHEALGHRKRATNAYARAFALDNRLALPDVNPLVIGNPLVTAAMLTRHDVPLADNSPRSYSDPVTISKLLLPPAAPEPAGETAAGSEGSEANDASEGSQAPTEPGGRAAQPPGAPTVGEVRPPAAASSQSPSPSAAPAAGARGNSRLEDASPDSSDRRITSDDIRSLRILNQATPQPGATPPAEGGTRDRNLQAPQRFRPGRRSSAQLDLEVAPGRRSTAAAASVRRARL